MLSTIVNEGAMVAREFAPVPGLAAVFHWAPDPDAPDESPRVIHVTVMIDGDKSLRQSREIRLNRQGWTAMRVEPGDIPADANSCRIVWNAGEAPPWERFGGVLPVVTSSLRLLLEGPTFCELHTEKSGPNVVILAMDGLGAGRGMPYGDSGRSLHSLLRLAAVSVTFPNAYTPAPDPVPAYMSLLTGLPPLEHRYLGQLRGPLPEKCETLAERFQNKGFLTAAFTEGDAGSRSDLVFESDFARGFVLFDSASNATLTEENNVLQVTSAAANAEGLGAGSGTLGRALAWLNSNRGTKSMVFIRLRQTPSNDGTAADLDRQLAELIRVIREDGNICLLITAPCGRSALGGRLQGAKALTEAALRVPLVFFVPGARPGERDDVLSLEEAGFALLRVAGGDAEFLSAPEKPKEGMPAQKPAPISTDAVAVSGDPLAMSIRADQWRLTWQTGVSLSAPGVTGLDGGIVLYDVDRLRRGAPVSDMAKRNPGLATSLQEQLREQLAAYGQGPAAAW